MKLTVPDGTVNVFIGPHRLLPADRTRFVGEALVMVVGETMASALDGAEAVEIDYADLPFVAETDRAALSDAAVWDEVPDNVLVDTRFGDKAATDAAFATADHVVSAEFIVAGSRKASARRCGNSPMLIRGPGSRCPARSWITACHGRTTRLASPPRSPRFFRRRTRWASRRVVKGARPRRFPSPSALLSMRCRFMAFSI